MGLVNDHHVPTAADDVTIPGIETPNGAGTITHSQDVADSVHSITQLSSPLDLGAGSITVLGNSSISGAITVEAGAKLAFSNATVNSTGTTIANHGTLALDGSTLGPGVGLSTTAFHALDLTGADLIQHDLTVPAGATVTETADNTTLTVEGNIQTSADDVALGGANSSVRATGSYTALAGRTDLNGGTLVVGAVVASFVGPAPASLGAEALFDQGSTLTSTGGTVTGVLLENAGLVEPMGTLAVSGNYQQDATGVLSMTVGGTTPGTGYDQLTAGGTATLGGTLDVATTGGFVPSPGDAFVLVQSTGGDSGQFTTTSLDAGPNRLFQLDYASNEVVLNTTGVPATVVNGDVSVARLGFRYDRARKEYVQPVTITNTTTTALAAPLYLALEGLPSGVSLVNQSGAAIDYGAGNNPVPVGTPYLTLSGGLAPGQSLTVYLRFSDTSNVQIGWTPVVLQGADSSSLP
ncbi:MAG TPA: hypothetical protein VG406_14915 [Isosphaeraceae bacterium]|nr:hypothetical protein [Isosphaeraceae bacterium]